jgi:hypothetical protein
VVAKPIWDSTSAVFDFRPGLLWVYVFPPDGARTGIVYAPFYMGDEHNVCHNLRAVNAADARAAFDAARAQYLGPSTW